MFGLQSYGCDLDRYKCLFVPYLVGVSSIVFRCRECKNRMGVHEDDMGMDGFRRSYYCSCQRIIGPGRHSSKNGLIVKWWNPRRYSKEGVRVLAPRGASGSRSRVGEGVYSAVPPPFHPQSVQSLNFQEDSRGTPQGFPGILLQIQTSVDNR